MSSGQTTAKFLRLVTESGTRIVCGPDDGKGPEIGRNLRMEEFEPICKSVNVYQEAVALRIAQAFLANGQTWGIDATGLKVLLEAALQTSAREDYFSNVWLNSGHGGNDDWTPLRAIIHPLAVWETQRALLKLGIRPPRARIFWALNLAIKYRAADADQTWVNTVTLAALQKLFVEQFMPEISHFQTFDFDRPVEYGDIERTIESLAVILDSQNGQDPQVQQAVLAVTGMAQRHGSDRLRALRYAAAHGPTFYDYHYGSTQFSPFGESEHFKTVRTMFGWGPKAETKFRAARVATIRYGKKVWERFEPVPWAMLYQRVGESKPAYYPDARDIAWEDARNHASWYSVYPSTNQSVNREVDTLTSVAGGIDQLIVFIGRVYDSFEEVLIADELDQDEKTYHQELLAHRILDDSKCLETAGRDIACLDSSTIQPLILAARQQRMGV